MRALDFWRAVAVDEASLLERFVRLLETKGIRYCLVGGQAVNAYVEPLASLNLDVVIAGGQLSAFESSLPAEFNVERFAHSVNLSVPGSDLRIQIQTDPRYAGPVDRAAERPVLGLVLPIARLEDVLQGKIWAAQDQTRHASRRQKDLADIARIIESYPALRDSVPADILGRLAE